MFAREIHRMVAYWSPAFAGTTCRDGARPMVAPFLRVRYERTAVQMPEQTPDGPVPFHFPLPLAFVNCPVPLARRGPATAFILVCPPPEMRPSTRMR